MKVEREVFESINFACYTEGWILSFGVSAALPFFSILSFSLLCPCWSVALRRLDSHRCEDKESSLVTVVKPGKRLGVYHLTSLISASFVAVRSGLSRGLCKYTSHLKPTVSRHIT